MSSERGISTLAASALIVVAVIFDGLQALIYLLVALPFIGLPLALTGVIFINLCAFFLFGIWFSHLGVCLLARYPLAFIGATIFEFIPGIDAIPGWTGLVIKVVFQERVRATTSPSDKV